MSGLQKNVASQTWVVFAFNRTNNQPLTGDAANVTANIKIGGAAAAATNDVNPTELEDGYYEFDLTQAETNADVLVIFPASSTADIQVIGVPGRIFTVADNFPDLGIETDGDLTKVNTLDAHTAQTGDNFTRLGAPAGASVSADIAAIESQTDDIGVAGAGLTAIPFPGVAAIADGIWDELQSGHTAAGTFGEIATEIAAILVDTADMQPKLGTPVTDLSADIAVIEAQTDDIGVAGAGLTSIPWNAAWDVEVESEVNDALDTAIAELAQAAPTATPTIRTALMLMYMALRNKLDIDANFKEVHDDAGTVISKKALTDDATTYSEAEMVTGP